MGQDKTGHLAGDNHGRAVIALAIAHLVCGLHYLLAKEVFKEIPPLVWAGLRTAPAAMILIVIGRFQFLPKGRGEWKRVAIMAFLWVMMAQVFFAVGLEHTDTTHGAWFIASIPTLTLGMSIGLGRERWSKPALVSLVFTSVGVTLLLLEKGELRGKGTYGDLFLLASAICSAFYTVLAPRLIGHMPTLTATTGMFICGAIGNLLIASPFIPGVAFATVQTSTWWCGAAIIAGPTILAYLFITYASKRLAPSVVGLFLYLQALSATGIGIVVLDEPVTWQFGLAAVSIATGLTIAVRRHRVATK